MKIGEPLVERTAPLASTYSFAVGKASSTNNSTHMLLLSESRWAIQMPCHNKNPRNMLGAFKQNVTRHRLKTTHSQRPTMLLNIEILHIQCILFHKLPTRFHILTYHICRAIILSVVNRT